MIETSPELENGRIIVPPCHSFDARTATLHFDRVEDGETYMQAKLDQLNDQWAVTECGHSMTSECRSLRCQGPEHSSIWMSLQRGGL